jgi:uncharacterized protein YaiL (DUF2058 family)
VVLVEGEQEVRGTATATRAELLKAKRRNSNGKKAERLTAKKAERQQQKGGATAKELPAS